MGNIWITLSQYSQDLTWGYPLLTQGYPLLTKRQQIPKLTSVADGDCTNIEFHYLNVSPLIGKKSPTMNQQNCPTLLCMDKKTCSWRDMLCSLSLLTSPLLSFLPSSGDEKGSLGTRCEREEERAISHFPISRAAEKIIPCCEESECAAPISLLTAPLPRLHQFNCTAGDTHAL